MTSLSDSLDVLSALVLDDGARWAEVASDFQWRDARTVLDPDAAPYSSIWRSRGGSKTTDAAGYAISLLTSQLPPGSQAFGAASDRDQAQLLLQSFSDFCQRTPMLQGRFQVDTWKATDRTTGSSLTVLASDAASSWGLRPKLLVCDEIAMWANTPNPRRLWESLSSAIAKNSDAKLVTISTPGDPLHWSKKHIYDHACQDQLWSLLETTGKPPWMSEARFEEQRRRLVPSSFARLFLGEWTASSEDHLASPEDLDACITHRGSLPPKPGLHRYLCGVDLGWERDPSACVIAHSEPFDDGRDGRRIVVDALGFFPSTGERRIRLSRVKDWVNQAQKEYRLKKIIGDAAQFKLMAEEFQASGATVDLVPFSAPLNNRLALALREVLIERRLALPDDEGLITELGSVRLKETGPHLFRLENDPEAEGHFDRVIALGLVVLELIDKLPINFPGYESISLDRVSPWKQPGEDSMSGVRVTGTLYPGTGF